MPSGETSVFLPQCGFASCEIGNKHTEDEQWAKIALVKRIAEEVGLNISFTDCLRLSPFTEEFLTIRSSRLLSTKMDRVFNELDFRRQYASESPLLASFRF